MSAVFVTRYDFRAPGLGPEGRREIYGRALEQAAYVDRHGQVALMLSEHHASPDGYLPSPLPVAAAFAAVTTSIPITVSALLGNLYDPVRLAEDISVVDHLSGGRVAYTFGLGYRPEEYAVHGRPWPTRGADLERQITTLLRLWTGEQVEVEGRQVRVTPPPYSRPHPTLFYGGGSEAAARRAARLGLHFQPQVADVHLQQVYEDECRALGRGPGLTMLPPAGPAAVFCAPDPEAFWERHGHHLLADARAYEEWRGDADTHVRDESTTVEELREAGNYLVATADELVERCRSGEIALVTSHPACGGLPAEPSWESLRLVCETVMPAVSGSG